MKGRAFDDEAPVVIVCNNVEVIQPFLEAAGAGRELDRKLLRGDRALFWLGGPKLVIVSSPIPHLDYLRTKPGYAHVSVAYPEHPSAFLSSDILREPDLVGRIISYARPANTIKLVPYAATPQFLRLAERLRDEHGLQVLLPETPQRENAWVRDYIDSKAGFRALAGLWLPNARELLLEGFVARSPAEAAEMVRWFTDARRACIVKASLGESGLGHTVFPPDTPDSVAQLTDAIRGNPYLRRGDIVVEEYLESATVQSPSLELFVPAAGHGEPIITYLSDQLFLDDVGSTCGVFISRDLMETAWYPALAGAGLTIARNLQRMGYVGHFDLDTILSDDGRIFLLEVNARRTAGTHAHEFGEYSLGPNYLDEHVVLCLNKMASGAIRDVEALESAIGELAWPARGTNAGVVIAATSGLAAGEFGCILIAPTRDEVVGLLHVIAERLGGGATPARGLAMNLNGA